MIIISPSKNLNINKEEIRFKFTKPQFQDKSKKLAKLLKSLSLKEIKDLMKISDNLANINKDRILNFDNLNNIRKPAVYLFSGGTFDGLSIRKIEKQSYDFIQEKLRILSGLYGILKPFDEIQPYRLEMGTNTENLFKSSLYTYWRKEISIHLNNELVETKSKILFNLSSKEYFSVLDEKTIKAKIINFDFKIKKNGEYKNLGMQIKKLRGAMARYIIERQIDSEKLLKNFSFESFKFDTVIPQTNTYLYTTK